MADLPSQTPTIDAIYRRYELREESEPRRGYLGGSQIGVECRRALWLSFRWVGRPVFPGRILRLFETGNMEERRLLGELRDLGYRVDGEQFEVSFCDGHGGGHIDGAVLGMIEAPKTWHLVEGKSMNKRNFDELLKKGCREAKPVYWAQCQLYMGEAGFKRAALFVWCKDDDRLYLERIHYDKGEHEALIRKANGIIFSDAPPARLSDDPSFFKCKWCDQQMMCHQQIVPDINCRTCAHGEPVSGGLWQCGRFDILCPPGQVGCDDHIFNPHILWWLTPIDGSPSHIEYENFNNVAATGFADNGKPSYSSKGMQER